MKKYLVILFLLIACPVWGATYYVSLALGDDTRTSTQALNPSTPWKHHPDSNLATSNSAAKRTTFSAGDIIVMRKGERWDEEILTTGKAGTAGNPIVTTTEDDFGSGDDPIISSARRLTGSWTETGINDEYKIALTTEPSVVYNGDTGLQKGTAGSLSLNSFGWSANELYVRIGGDPTGGEIEAGIYPGALRVNHSYRSYKNLDIRYSQGTTSGAVYGVNANYLVISDSSISRIYQYGIRVYNGISPDLSYNSITGATYHGTGSAIYLSDGTTNGVVLENKINAMQVGISPGLLATISQNEISNTILGIKITTSGNYIYGNKFNNNWNGLEYGSGGAGADIEVSGSASHNLIINNYSTGGYCPVCLQSSSGDGQNIFAYNHLRDYKVNGITLGTGGTTIHPDYVYNNTIIHNPTAGTPAGSIGHGIVIGSLSTHSAECTHANIKNNLLVGMTAGAEMVSMDADNALYPDNMDKIDIDYNLYWQYNSGSRWRIFGTGTDTTDFTTWKASLSTTTGGESHGINVLSTDEAPMNLTTYMLQSGSPAKGAGANVGLSNTNPPDIGAEPYTQYVPWLR